MALLFVWPAGFVCDEVSEPPEPLPPFFIGDTVCRPGTDCTEPKRYFVCQDTQGCHDKVEEFKNASNNPDPGPPPLVSPDPSVFDSTPVPESNPPVAGD